MFTPFPGSRIGKPRIARNSKAYLGQIATRTALSDTTTASTTGWMSRTFHIARDNITALKVAFANWHVAAASGETDQSGNVETSTASIEYPAGVFHQLKFNGSASGTAQDMHTLFSDWLPVLIPMGATFWVRHYSVNTVGINYLGNGFVINTSAGDAFANNNSDLTMSGTVTDGGFGCTQWPQAIIGMTTRPSVCIIGDSRSVGLKDTTVDATGDTGYARIFGGSYAYMNYGLSSDTLTSVAAGRLRTMILAGYCSHLFLPIGINDIAAAVPAATVQACLRSLYDWWPNPKKVIPATLSPETTSTDSWATTANQTVFSSSSLLTTHNTWIRGLTAYATPYDIAAVTMTALNSNKWQNNGTANKWTPDGIHESTFACQQIQASIVPSLVL